MNHSCRVCFILPYFGEWPVWIDLFFESCNRNPGFNWVIITDLKKENVPRNVQLVHYTLDQLKSLFEAKLGYTIPALLPYKLCDYKPGYGYFFEDLLEGVDFWGHCDIDMAFGDLAPVLNDDRLVDTDIYSPYDRSCGHFQLYRNNESTNSLFLKINGLRKYLSMKSTFGLDEPFFEEVLYEEGENIRWLKLEDLKTEYESTYPQLGATVEVDGSLNGQGLPKEVEYCWQNGHVKQVSELGDKEFMYLHWYQWKQSEVWTKIMGLKGEFDILLHEKLFEKHIQSKANSVSMIYQIKLIVLRLLSYLPNTQLSIVQQAKGYTWRANQTKRMRKIRREHL